GSFGVITSFTIKPVKPAAKVTSFSYEWKLSDHAQVLKAYIDLQATASRDLGVEMNVGHSGLELYGIFQGTKSQQQAALASFFKAWAAVKPKGATSNYIIVDLWGGAVADHAATETSFVHRNAHSVFEFVVEWSEGSNAKPGKADCKPCLKWMDDMYKEFLDDYKKNNYDSVARGYQNYIDRAMPNWQEAYYGQAMPRLRQIKSAVDPANVFRFPQSIPLK
ncbi:hypothetical protein BGZ68_008738, partial [Mortierella alpina]